MTEKLLQITYMLLGIPFILIGAYAVYEYLYKTFEGDIISSLIVLITGLLFILLGSMWMRGTENSRVIARVAATILVFLFTSFVFWLGVTAPYIFNFETVQLVHFVLLFFALLLLPTQTLLRENQW